MTQTPHNLGQAASVANTPVSVTGVIAGGHSYACSSLVVCNQNTSTVKIRIAHRVNNAAITGVKEYLYYDDPLPPGTRTYTIGITATAGDSIEVTADQANVGFNLYGIDQS